MRHPGFTPLRWSSLALVLVRGIDDTSLDRHRLKRPEREGSEFRKGGPGGTAPSDPGLGGL